MNALFAGLPTTIFEAMSALARQTGAINLGQGFPDDPGPADVRARAAEALLHGNNQYPPMMGTPALRSAIAAHYARFGGLHLDPNAEVMVTSGATEALAGALLALLEPGDEVIVFAPAYDAYLPLIRRAGGVPRIIRLQPPDWSIPTAAVAAAITPRTRVILLNNPLNPTGTVYPAQALAPLAALCVEHDLVALCDEVWEHVVFDGRVHCPMMTLPGMRDRTIKIGSAGKIFSLTGWKVGLVCASPPLLKVLAKAHQFLTFTTPPNLQEAVAYGLAKETDWFLGQRAALQRSRDRLAAGLRARGLPVLDSAGTYFLNVDIGALGATDDVAFCRRLAQERGVAAIPVSAFYEDDPVRTVIRFCFAKTDAVLDGALDRLVGLEALVD